MMSSFTSMLTINRNKMIPSVFELLDVRSIAKGVHKHQKQNGLVIGNVVEICIDWDSNSCKFVVCDMIWC